MILFYGHPTCTTCKRVEKWMKEHNVPYEWKNIKEETPDKKILETLLQTEQVTRKQLLNTSGNLYKELGLKDKVDTLTNQEVASLIKEDGMLLRRPFIMDGNRFTIGAKVEQLNQIWLTKEDT